MIAFTVLRLVWARAVGMRRVYVNRVCVKKVNFEEIILMFILLGWLVSCSWFMRVLVWMFECSSVT